MLYNIEKKKVMRPTDCILCAHYDKKQKNACSWSSLGIKNGVFSTSRKTE